MHYMNTLAIHNFHPDYSKRITYKILGYEIPFIFHYLNHYIRFEMTSGKYYGKPNKIKTNRTTTKHINKRIHGRNVKKEEVYFYFQCFIYELAICPTSYCQTIFKSIIIDT